MDINQFSTASKSVCATIASKQANTTGIMADAIRLPQPSLGVEEGSTPLSHEALETDSLNTATRVKEDEVTPPMPNTSGDAVLSDEATQSGASTRVNEITEDEVNPPMQSDKKLREDEEDMAYDRGLGSKILAHFKLLAAGSKTMWRMLLCSFLYTFLIFEETDIFLAVFGIT